MWQLLALGSQFAIASAEIVDKYALWSQKKIDTTVATFWRIAFYMVMSWAVAWTGLLGPAHLAFEWLMVGIAAVGILNSLFYTYLMRHVEVTGIGALGYVAPFAFLLIDTQIMKEPLSAFQISGIILLIVGGAAFAIDARTHRMKKEFSPRVLLFFAFSAVYMGVEAYLFKYLHATEGMNSITFVVTYGTMAAAGLLALVVVQRKTRLLWNRSIATYVPRIAVSKFFGVVNSVLWMEALVFATVSQVTAMGALAPLILFVMTVGVQNVLRLRLGERLARTQLVWKAGAVSLLVLGGFLVGA